MTTSTKPTWPTADTFANFSHAVLLRGDHKAGQTIKPEPADVLATVEIKSGGGHLTFDSVKPRAKDDRLGAVALTNDLEGEVLVVIDKSMADANLWPTPNGSDIEILGL